ncbi:MAG: hypothetical protein KDH15_15690 [Rhodocyclaceae bacterium]|nr:hypothetical protein [Rhodocyclaceae bacterium]
MKAPFVIDPNPTVLWPVVVALPQGGSYRKHRFTATFRVLPEAEYAALEAASRNILEAIPAGEKSSADLVEFHAEQLPRLVVAWDGPADAAGAPIPVAALPDLLRGPYGKPLAFGINRAISQIRYGVEADDEEEERPGASEGNSAPSPAAG